MIRTSTPSTAIQWISGQPGIPDILMDTSWNNANKASSLLSCLHSAGSCYIDHCSRKGNSLCPAYCKPSLAGKTPHARVAWLLETYPTAFCGDWVREALFYSWQQLIQTPTKSLRIQNQWLRALGHKWDIYVNPHLKVWRTSQESMQRPCRSQRMGRSGVRCCLLGVKWLLYSRAPSAHGYLHKSCVKSSIQHSDMGGSHNSHPLLRSYWQHMAVTGRRIICPCSSGGPHIHGSTD